MLALGRWRAGTPNDHKPVGGRGVGPTGASGQRRLAGLAHVELVELVVQVGLVAPMGWVGLQMVVPQLLLLAPP